MLRVMPYSPARNSLRGTLSLVRLAVWAAMALLALSPRGLALEHVTIERDGHRESISGQVAVEAQDGGLLVMTRDGALVAVEPKQIVERRQDDEPFRPLRARSWRSNSCANCPTGSTRIRRPII